MITHDDLRKTKLERVVKLINQMGNSLDAPAHAEKVLTECGKNFCRL